MMTSVPAKPKPAKLDAEKLTLGLEIELEVNITKAEVAASKAAIKASRCGVEEAMKAVSATAEALAVSREKLGKAPSKLGAEKLTPEEQRRRFIEAAREAGASEDEAAFDATLRRISKPKKADS